MPQRSPPGIHDLSSHVCHHHPALISGRSGTDELPPYSFVLLWSTLTIARLPTWYGQRVDFGLYGGLGALDFAGGTVVH